MDEQKLYDELFRKIQEGQQAAGSISILDYRTQKVTQVHTEDDALDLLSASPRGGVFSISRYVRTPAGISMEWVTFAKDESGEIMRVDQGEKPMTLQDFARGINHTTAPSLLSALMSQSKLRAWKPKVATYKVAELEAMDKYKKPKRTLCSVF
jgi:hypothetical protein